MEHDWEEFWEDRGGGSRMLSRTVCRNCGLEDSDPRFFRNAAGGDDLFVRDRRSCLEVTVDAVHDL